MSSKKEFNEKYDKMLGELQIKLVNMQEWVIHSGAKIAVVFEGRDAAGKGGTIKRVTENLNPRYCKIIALAEPTERKKTSGIFSVISLTCQPVVRLSFLTEAGITVPG